MELEILASKTGFKTLESNMSGTGNLIIREYLFIYN